MLNMDLTTKKHIDSYSALANGLRFKLWAIVGKNDKKKQRILNYLTNTLNWTIIDVESHLVGMYQELEQFKVVILNFESSVLSGQKGDYIRIKFEE